MEPSQTRKEVRKIKATGDMRNCLHHNLNSLHVYCRLVNIMPGWLAREIVMQWEKTAIYGHMYARI